MKKPLLIIALLCAAAGVKAQTKQFQPTPKDWQTPVQFTVKVTTGQMENYFTVLQQGGVQGITTSPKLTGEQITNYLKDYQAVVDSMNNSSIKVLNIWYKQVERKWAADTAKIKKQ